MIEITSSFFAPQEQNINSPGF